MSQLHQERAPGAKEHSRFSIDPPDLRMRTEHPRLRTGGIRANKREALLQRGSIDRFWNIAHDRPDLTPVWRSKGLTACTGSHGRVVCRVYRQSEGTQPIYHRRSADSSVVKR